MKQLICIHCHHSLDDDADSYRVCPYCGIHITWKVYRYVFSFINGTSVLFIKENTNGGAISKLRKLVYEPSQWKIDMVESV